MLAEDLAIACTAGRGAPHGTTLNPPRHLEARTEAAESRRLETRIRACLGRALRPPQARQDARRELPAYMNRGSENNLFVARAQAIEAWDVIPPGQSGFYDPRGQASEHSHDQMQLYAQFRYKRVPFTVSDVKAMAVSSQQLILDRRF